MHKLIALLLALTFIIAAFASAEEENNMKLTPVFDRVAETGIYTELDYEAAEKFFAQNMQIDGGCTAIVKTLENGDTIIGRNMDLNFSFKPAYIVRTKVPGCYETVGVSYTPFLGKSVEELLESGIDEKDYNLLPFACTDVMNSAGLYVEINMRNGETDENGDLVFRCKGTNPASDHRVCSINLVRYIGEHCGSVAEVKDYLNTLDIFTPCTDSMNWNFCFIVADASGNRALIEIARDKISFLEGESAQANFYLTDEFAALEKEGAGYGRYEQVTGHIDEVRSEEDMMALMDSVAYFTMYSEDCAFDARSEIVGAKPGWTTEYVLDEANAEEVEAHLRHLRQTIPAKSLKQLATDGDSWLSVFTEVANCSERTLTVKFFEDGERVIKLGF